MLTVMRSRTCAVLAVWRRIQTPDVTSLTKFLSNASCVASHGDVVCGLQPPVVIGEHVKPFNNPSLVEVLSWTLHLRRGPPALRLQLSKFCGSDPWSDTPLPWNIAAVTEVLPELPEIHRHISQLKNGKTTGPADLQPFNTSFNHPKLFAVRCFMDWWCFWPRKRWSLNPNMWDLLSWPRLWQSCRLEFALPGGPTLAATTGNDGGPTWCPGGRSHMGGQTHVHDEPHVRGSVCLYQDWYCRCLWLHEAFCCTGWPGSVLSS